MRLSVKNLSKNQPRISKTALQPGLFWKLLLIVSLIAGSGVLVYLTGGIKYVYSHTIYLSIIMGAYFFGIPGGILVGILAGLVLGPYMPLNVQTGEMQTTVNWLYRMSMFIIVGGVLGYLFSLVMQQVVEIRRMALYDRNTGLPNRSHLYLDLDKLLKQNDKDSKYAVFIILVDNHSRITRILEMEEMNRLNGMVSARLKTLLEEKAVVYQLFPYLLCAITKVDSSEGFCHSIAETVYDELQTPFEISNIPVFINVSIGIAINELNSLSPSYFLQKGIMAAQIASERELKYWVYSKEEFVNVRDSQALLGDVTAGMEHHEFDLHYQPIVELATGKVKAVEALLRWNHHKLGMIPPMKFLPTLEHTSLLYSIHEWELEVAIKQLTVWSGYSGKMSINLSTRLLLDDSWIHKFEDLLEQFRIDPQRIIFEITETAIMKDIENSKQTLAWLKKIGSLISLDDFGTGYSSLEYIQMLPLDHLKIDQHFIKNSNELPKSRQIVQVAISLSDSIELESIAEGIETSEMYDWLTKAGCKYGQGYFIGKPMAGADFAAWLTNHA